MYVNPQKMKNKTESSLQKELEFYTNLLAQHERNEQNKRSNLPLSSTSQPKRLGSTYPNKTIISSQASSTYKLSNLNFPDNKRTYPPMHIAKIETPKKTFSSRKGILSTSSNNNLNVQKDRSPNNTGKNISFKSVSYVKTSPRNISRISFKNNNKIDFDNNLKSINSKVSHCEHLCEKKCAKSDSRKLMGEIMAITQQLKLKSKTLGSSDKMENIQNPQPDAFSKLAQKKAAKESICLFKKEVKDLNIKSLDYVIPFQACTNRSKLFSAFASKNNAQMQARHVAKSFENPVDAKNVKFKTAHTDMLQKLNAIEKVLANATEKTSKEMLSSNCTLNRFKKSKANIISCIALPKEPVSSDDNNLVSCAGSFVLDHKTANKKSITKQNLKFNMVSLENSILKACSSSNKLISCQPPNCKFSSVSDKTILKPKATNLLNSKYKVVNKVRTTGKVSLEKRASVESAKKRRRSLSSKKRSISTYTIINGDRKTSAHLRNSPNYMPSFKKSSVKNSFFNSCMPSQYASLPLKRKSITALNTERNLSYTTSKYCFRKTNAKVSGNFPKNRSLDTVYDVQNSSIGDVDVDLLLELAAENKISPLLQRRLYKSKNRIINSHSVQARTARMIKSKYFNSSKRPFEWKNHVTVAKNFKGYSRNYVSKHHESRNKMRKINHATVRNFSNKFQSQKVCPQKKKIVYLKGEKFIVGSSGKSLKKITKQTSNYYKKTKRSSVYKKSPLKMIFSVKTATPNSKIMASRVLNRSINRMLSASVKKMHKVNTFCMFYNRFGRCNKGLQCPYVHDPSKIAVCTRFLRGTCKNDKCLFSHEISPGKMAICSFFLQDACTNEDCPYRHEKLSPDAELCKAFVQGYCPSGKNCKKAHVLICPKYIQGICDKGKDCVFPHPVDKEKKPISKTTAAVKKEDDQILETVRRYFQSSPQESLVRGLVVPRIKTLPEQPSYISLTLDETS